MTSKFKTDKGITLVEFLTVLLIIVIITTVSTPYLGSLMARYQSESVGTYVLSLIKLCNVEAIKQGHKSIGCNLSKEENTLFFRIFIDENHNGSFNSNGDIILRESAISNIAFVNVRPDNATWFFNSDGRFTRRSADVISICGKNDDNSIGLNQIHLKGNGLIYLEEVENMNCG